MRKNATSTTAPAGAPVRGYGVAATAAILRPSIVVPCNAADSRQYTPTKDGQLPIRSFRAAAALALLWLIPAACAGAGIVDAPGRDLEVSLITYGPGAIYWERFGHDAIEIRDRVSGQAISFNYGVFDFDERGFLLNFARGYMHYMIDAEESDADQSYYRGAGRSIVIQRLALSDAQAAKLRDFLLWNLQPANAGYRYDYLTDNCATRVRDALNLATGGAIKPQLIARPGGMTYRQQIDRLMSVQPWLMLLMDLGLGPFADQPLNAWQASFLPVVLQEQLRQVRIGAGRGGLRPLVRQERLVARNRLTAPPEAPPDLRLPFALAGLAFAALLVWSLRRWSAAYAVLATVYLLKAGVIGLFLLGLWTLTQHHAAWENANLLLFNPLAFGLVPAVWRVNRGAGVSRLALGLVALQLILLPAALLLHLAPGTVQQNQPWLLFAIPAWSALAWSLANAAKVALSCKPPPSPA